MRPPATRGGPCEADRMAPETSGDDLRLGPNEVEVWCASLDDMPAGLLQSIDAALSPDEIERARSFHFEQDRRRYVAARGILRLLLARHLERAPAAIKLEYGPNGKPSVGADPAGPGGARNARSLHFNVAHSEGLALHAFTLTGAVGIDLEFIRDVPDWEQVAASTFGPHEQAHLRACPPERRREEFFRAWTRQEAVLKAIGIGLGGVSASGAGDFKVHELQPAPGFAAALATPPAVQWAMLRRWRHEAWSATSGGGSQGGRRIQLEDIQPSEAYFL